MDKEYHRAYSKEWYSRDRENKIEQRRKRRITVRAENIKFLRELKESSPCKDCGQYFPFYVMQFDHLRDKRASLSSMISWSRKSILEELEKCELVCANCHAVRTYIRL